MKYLAVQYITYYIVYHEFVLIEGQTSSQLCTLSYPVPSLVQFVHDTFVHPYKLSSISKEI